MLTVYTVLDNNDAFGLDDFVRSVAPPEADGVENFGYNVTGLGDVNGDGRPDFAVAAPGRLPDPIGSWGGVGGGEGPQGSVYIYSGADLSLIRTLTNHTSGFGAAMAAVGDLDADGVPDLVVGSPNVDNNADLVVDQHGRITVYSGANGGIITSINGAGRFFEFGYSLATIGDFDGDGHDDVIVGAPAAGTDPSVTGPGCAFVYSLIDSALLHTFTGENVGDRFGHAVVGTADIPASATAAGDGVKDFVVGAPGHDGSGSNSGRAYVYNGQTGALFTHATLGDGLPAGAEGVTAGDITPDPGDRFGSSVGFIGMDAAGEASSFLLRILVGAPGADRISSAEDPIDDRGIVYSYTASGAVGVLVDMNFIVQISPAPDDRFGERITTIGDVVGADGLSEVAILAPGNTRGGRLTIGNGNFTNFTATGLSNVGQYSSVAVIGDADNDGIDDFAFGDAGDGFAPHRVQVVPFSVATGSLNVGAISDDGAFLTLTSSLGSISGSGEVGYLVRDGRLISYRDAGLDGLSVRAINNAGLIFADQSVIEGGGVIRIDQYLVFDGVRTLFSQAVTNTVGPAPTSTLSIASMSNTGDLVFNAANGAYLFRGGSLIFLWEGGVGHVNDSGVVVGVGPRDGPPGPSPDIVATGVVRMFTPAGQAVDIPGLRTTGIGKFIDNRGRIYGQNDAGALLVWDNGAFSELARFSDLGLTGAFFNWTVTDVDETGKVAATVHYSDFAGGGRPPSSSPSANYLFEPGAGLRGTAVAIANPLAVPLPPPSGSGSPISRLINGNAVLVEGHLAVPQPLAGAVTTAPDHPINVTWTNRGLDVAASTAGGQAVVLRLTGEQAGLWLAAPLPLVSAAIVPPPIVQEVAIYTDPRDGRSYAIVRLATQLVWFTQTFEGVYDEGRILPVPAPIVGNLAVFTSADNRVHVVGLSAAGDVIMLFQFNQSGLQPTDLANWGAVNLSADHLEPQGQSTPNFVSDLTAYVAPWNGLNIAGIDDQGRVHTVWWAPGLTFWQTSNLSDIAAAPALTGNVTSYVTSWSGLNVAGTTNDGEVAALWWVPELGGEWRFDVLVPQDARGLRPGSLSAYVTPWGGLNVAGIDPDTNKVAVYWWTPTTPWAFENLPIEGGSPTIEGRVSAIATPPGQLDILARGEDDQLLRFSWNPGDGQAWTVDDIGARNL